MDNYVEARHQKVIRPQLAALGRHFDQWITAASPLWQRKAAVQLTRYLSCETGYRQDLTEEAGEWEECKTACFSIVTEIADARDGRDRDALIGILTFHQFKENAVLYHCYLHPFFRRQGLMGKAWVAVQERYPQFEIEPPRSPAMESFLRKVDQRPILPST